MPDSAIFRGEGGGLHTFDLPLPELYAEQERKGQLVRVAPSAPAVVPVAASVVEQVPHAEPVVDEDLGSLERPARSDDKTEWVAYAAQVSGQSKAELNKMTKAALVAEFGG